MRLWHLLHEMLTETTLVQPIVLSYPQPNSMSRTKEVDLIIFIFPFSFYFLFDLFSFILFLEPRLGLE